MEFDDKRHRWCEIDGTHKLLLRMRRQNAIRCFWGKFSSLRLSLIS